MQYALPALFTRPKLAAGAAAGQAGRHVSLALGGESSIFNRHPFSLFGVNEPPLPSPSSQGRETKLIINTMITKIGNTYDTRHRKGKII